MHFPSTFAVTVILSTVLASAAPLPKHTHLGSRGLSRRQELIERLQARAPISVSAIQHFARATPSGGDKCIDGALDYILALATGSSPGAAASQSKEDSPPTSAPSRRFAGFGDLLEVPSNDTAPPTSDGSGSAGNSTDATLPFLDDCLEELVAWAVTKFVTLLEASSGGESAPPTASDAPSVPAGSDASNDPSDAAPSDAAPSDAPSPSATATAPSSSADPQSQTKRHVRRAWVDDFIGNVLAKIGWIPDLTSASLAEAAAALQTPQSQTKRQIRHA
ncbi:hypothetical protein B0H13DRAFT_2400696 [Mycena leptocephala]|nr:hypothetical protein B0H13DRAFT_2400696 [Mycena leptocephala]